MPLPSPTSVSLQILATVRLQVLKSTQRTFLHHHHHISPFMESNFLDSLWFRAELTILPKGSPNGFNLHLDWWMPTNDCKLTCQIAGMNSSCWFSEKSICDPESNCQSGVTPHSKEYKKGVEGSTS